MLNIKKIIVIGVICYLLGLIVFFPARWVEPFVSEQVQADVTWKKVSGSIWRGQLTQLSYKQLPLGDLHWTLSLMDLLTLQLTAHWTLQGNQVVGQGDVSQSMSQRVFFAEQLTMPADYWISVLNIIGVRADGDMTIKPFRMVWQDKHITAINGQLDWHKARIRTPLAKIGLGHVRGEVVSSDGKQARLTAYNDTSLQLQLESDIELQRRRHQSVISINRRIERHFDQLLELIGAKSEGERLQLSLRGRY